MKLVLEIHPSHEDGHVVYRPLDASPVTLGRAFDNDIILNDPHIDAHHLRMERDGDAWFARDLNSANGVYMNGKLHHGGRVALKSGDAFRLGRTKIRAYGTDHAVPEPVKIEKENPIFPWLSKPVNVWACFMLALVIMMGWSFLEIWTDEPGLTLAATAAATVSVIIVWASLWSVAGRLVTRKAGFRNHVGIASLYLIAGAFAWYAEIYIDFLTNENALSQAVTYGINFILLSLLLYGSLSLSTHLPARRRLSAALFFSAGVSAGAFALGLIVAQNFSQQPLYPATLEPYLSWAASAKTPDAFMKENRELFSSEEFMR
jgi:hypothetical protein